MTTPMMNTTQRLATPANDNLSSTAQTLPVRLQKTAAPDKNTNLQPQKKSSKALRPATSSDNIKGRRQTNDVSSESSATRPDRDVPATVSKQHKDFTVDIRTPSQPPPQQLPVTDVCRPNSQLAGGRLREPSPTSETLQSSSNIRAEEFLQVSNLQICCSGGSVA